MADKDYILGVKVEGAAEAAAEVERLEKAVEGVGDEVAKQNDLKPAWAETAPLKESASSVQEVGKAFEGTGLSALGLGDKMSGVRERLAALRAAADQARGDDGAGLESLFPTFTKIGGSAAEMGGKLVEMAGGPIGILTAAVGALTLKFGSFQRELAETIQALNEAAEQASKTAESILKSTRTEAEVQAEAQPQRTEEFRRLARDQAGRLLDLKRQSDVLNDPLASPEMLDASFGGEEGIRSLIETVGTTTDRDALNLEDSKTFKSFLGLEDKNAFKFLRKTPAEFLLSRSRLLQAAREDLKNQITSAEKVAQFNQERFSEAQAASPSESSENAARDIEGLSREVASIGGTDAGSSAVAQAIATLRQEVEALKRREQASRGAGSNGAVRTR